ncbi:MAG TPA: hypothetical protein VL068_12965 [Microthrixaceae bacterium]|nr:hypothetical protein [Microthrixaceae bacterium]
MTDLLPQEEVLVGGRADQSAASSATRSSGTGSSESDFGAPSLTGMNAGAPNVLWLKALSGGLLALLGSRPLHDNSFLTHLATGRLILDSGLPSSNPFLFTGTSFPVPSYLWSIVLGGVDAVAGGTGLRLLTVAASALLGVLLVSLATNRAGSHFMGDRPSPVLLTVLSPVVLAGLVMTAFISTRPHLPGFVLLALMILVWKERRSGWFMVPIFAIWVNVHGTWLYGLAVLGMFVVAEAIDDRELLRRHFELIGAAVVGTIVGGALYPDHFAVVLLPTRQFGDATQREALMLYEEWKRVELSNPLLWIMIGLALIAVYGCFRNRRYAMTGAVVLLVAMGMSGFRLLPIAAIALVPFAALGLEGIGTLRLPVGKLATGLTTLGLAFGLLATFIGFRGPSYDLSQYPVSAVDWLETRGVVGGDIRTVSHDYVGNYLEWRFGADANTYVDDRPDAETFIDYVQMLNLGPRWKQVLKETESDVIIWKSKEKMTAALKDNPNWVKATTKGDFTVFCRKELAERCR